LSTEFVGTFVDDIAKPIARVIVDQPIGLTVERVEHIGTLAIVIDVDRL
jgi:hypothetical protein